MKQCVRIHICIGLGVMLLAGRASAQREQWLSYHTSREGRAWRWFTATTNPPSGVTLPRFNARPYFLRWSTPMDASGARWICLDRTRKSGPYDRLFVDTDGSGKLAGLKPLDADRVDAYQAYFPPVRMTFKGEDGPITYHLVMRCYGNRDNPPELLISPGGGYEGKVDFDGIKRGIQLIDADVNGTFNDVVPDNAYESDRIHIDGDKTRERFLGRMIEVDGKLYRIVVSRDGAYVKVQKAEHVVFGTVRVPENISEFSAFGRNGHFVRKPAKGVFTLPEGKYRVMQWKINRRDEHGADWTLRGYGFPKSTGFEVAAEKPVTLKIGEPVRTLLEAREKSGREVTFSLKFRGQMGESIEMLRENLRPRGPRLTLTNLAGSYRHTSYFQYG